MLLAHGKSSSGLHHSLGNSGASRYNQGMKNILIFGASIVHGVGSQNGGWAEKLKRSFHADMYGVNGRAGNHTDIYELGIPGNTMADITDRFLSEMNARVKHSKPEELCIVFSAGINDSRMHRDSSQHLNSADDFAAAVHSFIHLAKEYSAYVVGVGLTPVDEARTNPTSYGNQEYAFTNSRIREFEEAFARTCEAEAAYFVPLFDKAPEDWMQRCLFADGLHPNDEGQDWIMAQIEPELRRLIGSVA